MTEAGWAEKKIEKVAQYVWQNGYPMVTPKNAARVAIAEHARAIRVVKAEIRRVKMDQHTYHSEERCLILGSLETVLTALQRGRGGRG